MSHTDQISLQLNIQKHQINATVELLDAGNTIPFIARYRKEVTGSLDEKQIRDVASLLEKLRLLDERRNTILRTIDEQGELTQGLKDQIMAATTRTQLEDLYQPYKPKRRTRASAARENGLQPLADHILHQQTVSLSLDELATPYLNDVITDTNMAWAGA
ncbi:MAG: Tex-like N-terminal domain-containing protein, partial [Anaerolineales bacterium]